MKTRDNATPSALRGLALNHAYAGPAYPVHWGGRVMRGQEVHIAGRFHAQDFQDGAGVLLSNGEEGDLMGWVVVGRNMRRVRLATQTEPLERPERWQFVNDALQPDPQGEWVLFKEVSEVEKWEPARIAQAVAEYWRDESMKLDGPARMMAHPLAMVLSALAGETEARELGIPDDELARRLAALSEQGR